MFLHVTYVLYYIMGLDAQATLFLRLRFTELTEQCHALTAHTNVLTQYNAVELAPNEINII